MSILRTSRATFGVILLMLVSGLGLAACDPIATSGRCEVARPDPNPAEFRRTITSGGLERRYVIRFPAGYDGRTAHPLLLSFHGWSTVEADDVHEQFEKIDRLSEKALPKGYIVVYPAAIGDEFNYFGSDDKPNDYGFADDLIDELKTGLCVDPSRVYVSGHSAGSAFVGFYLCNTRSRLAGAAMVSATPPPFVPGIVTFCPPEVRVATLSFHGTKDPQVPYKGGLVGGTIVPIPGAEYNAERWAEQNRCQLPGSRTTPMLNVTRVAYTGCEGGREVVLNSIDGGGHQWPGAVYTGIENTMQGTSRDVPASDQIIEWFDHQRLPR